MKRKFAVIGAVVTSAFIALAVSISGTANAKSKDLPCQSDALKVATYVDNLSWGKGEPLQVESGDSETFKIKSTVSGYIYTVKIMQDYKTESCTVTSIGTQFSDCGE